MYNEKKYKKTELYYFISLTITHKRYIINNVLNALIKTKEHF